jgi:hypothetical protein
MLRFANKAFQLAPTARHNVTILRGANKHEPSATDGNVRFTTEAFRLAPAARHGFTILRGAILCKHKGNTAQRNAKPCN